MSRSQRIVIAIVIALMVLFAALFANTYQQGLNESTMRVSTFAAEIRATALATLSQ